MHDFLNMMQTLDAFFPIGTFTMSNGLEDYVVRNRLSSAKDLAEYIDQYIQIVPYNDLGLLYLSWKHGGEQKYICQLNLTALAVKSAQEIRNGSAKMCTRFIKARKAMKDCREQLSWYGDWLKKSQTQGVFAIALGLHAYDLEIGIDTVLEMYLYNLLSAIVNNAVKLVPLSQMDGQKILFEALSAIGGAVETAKTIELEDIGVNGAAMEIHSMNHAYLYSRQYIS